MIIMLGEFEYLVLSVSARLGDRHMARPFGGSWNRSPGDDVPSVPSTLLSIDSSGRGSSGPPWGIHPRSGVGAPSAWSGSRPGALEPRRSSTTHLSKRAEACGGRARDLSRDLKVMTRLAWLLVDVLSRALTPDDREAVRGDLEEAGGTGVGATREVLGLVLRRQAATWMDWRPGSLW